MILAIIIAIADITGSSAISARRRRARFLFSARDADAPPGSAIFFICDGNALRDVAVRARHDARDDDWASTSSRTRCSICLRHTLASNFSGNAATAADADASGSASRRRRMMTGGVE